MGEMRNLTEENVEVLKKQLESMKTENPDLEYRFYKQDSAGPTNQDIMDRLDELESKIAAIFDGHYLINGVWTKIKIPPTP